MKCLIFLLFFLKNIRNGEDFITVRKGFLLENDFWSEVQDPSTVNKEKNLYKVEILMEDKKNKWIGIKLTADICFYFKHTKMGYVLFKDWMVENIIDRLDLMRDDKSVLKFYFVYTDKPVEDSNHFSRYKGEIETYKTFKLPERCIKNNCISFKNDGIAISMFQIKEIFKRLAKINLIKLGRYISIIDPDESEDSMENIEGNTKFDLYFFENYSKCLKSLKKFVKTLRPLTLIEDNTFDSLDLQGSKIRVDFKSTLLVSEFDKRLKKKFANELKKYNVKNNKRVGRALISNFLCKSNNKLAETNNIELFDALFEKCCDYLKYEFFEGKVLFPIEGKYDIEYYIDALCKIIFKSFDPVDKCIDINNPREKGVIFDNIISILESNLSEFKETVLQDIFLPKLNDGYFSNLLGKEIKTIDDYIITEQIVRDYHNMFVYISNLARSIEDPSSILANYYLPMFYDNYNCKIINAIEIKFEYPAIFGFIKAFNSEKKRS